MHAPTHRPHLRLALAMAFSTAVGCEGGACSADLLDIIFIPADTCEQKITVSPDTARVPIGVDIKFTAVQQLTNCVTIDVTDLAAWSTSDSTLATVDDATGRKGLVRGVRLGITSVRARMGNTEGKATAVVTEAQLRRIDVTPAEARVARESNIQFVATGTFSDGTSADISSLAQWQSDDDTVIAVSDVSGSKGLGTGITPGNTRVSATYQRIRGTTRVTVTPARLMYLSVWPPLKTMAPGTRQQFTATAIYDDYTTADVTTQVTWNTSNDSAATVSNDASSLGVATAESAGTTTISAILEDVMGSAVVRVSNSEMSAISLTPVQPAIPPGASLPFTATALFTDNTAQNITESSTWDSTLPGAATVSMQAGSRGLVTGVSAGTTEIRAVANGVVGRQTLRVSSAGLTSIVVSPPVATIAMGTTQQLTAMGIYSDNSVHEITNLVTWGSSSEEAPVSNARGSQGLVVGIAPARVTITATLNGVTGASALNVSGAELVSLSVTPTNTSLPREAMQRFAAIGLFSDNTVQDLTREATWLSSDDNIARVSTAVGTQGLVMALQPGSTSINAHFQGVRGFTTLVVTDAVLESVEITPANPTIAMGTAVQFIARGFYSDNTAVDVTEMGTWTSSNSEISVLSNANGSRGLATGLGAGTTEVSIHVGNVSGTTILTVTSATLDRITVAPENAGVAKGTQQALTATGHFSDGTQQDMSSLVTWASSDGTVAIVSNAPGSRGTVAALNLGTTTISATFFGVTGYTPLRVTEAILDALLIDPSSQAFPNGTTLQLRALGVYTDGSQQDLTSSVLWESTEPDIAQVSNAPGSQGLVTAVELGEVSVTAAYNGVTGVAMLTVTNAALRSIVVEPGEAVTARGISKRFRAWGTFTDNTVQDISSIVTWTSSDDTVASFTSQTSPSLAHARLEGVVTVTASLQGITGTATLTVEPKTLVAISLNPGYSTIVRGTRVRFTATGIFSDDSTEDLTLVADWASEYPDVAETLIGAETRGTVVAHSTGTTEVYATMEGVIGSSRVVVTNAAIQSVRVEPETVTLARGFTLPLRAWGTFSDGSEQDLTALVDWSSSRGSVASVSNLRETRGVITGNGPGNATITATFDSVSGTSEVTGSTATLARVQLLPQRPEIGQGSGVRIRAVGHFSDASTQDLTDQATWSLSTEGILSPSRMANSNGVYFSESPGTVQVSVVVAGMTGSTPVTVTDATLSTIVIEPADTTTARGNVLPYSARGNFSDGSQQDVTEFVTWFTSDRYVAAISNAGTNRGEAYGVLPGVVDVRAVRAGVEATARLTVTP
ncbi:MAG: Ig-like domain-containing protein [Myxococcota bacterium]